jgi:hypothetical protein
MPRAKIEAKTTHSMNWSGAPGWRAPPPKDETLQIHCGGEIGGR